MTVILETVAYRAPLALRVIDAASGTDLADGLVATAWPTGDESLARTARRSLISSLLGFGTLPGLWSQEFTVAEGSASPTWPAPAPQAFVVTVVDSLNRYLPQTLLVQAPMTTPLAVTLYSAPARPRPAAWGMVYGSATVSPGGGPLAWAFITVSDGSSTYQTTTDTQGRFVVYLPYPEALPALAGNPPLGTGVGDVNWPVTLSVQSAPSTLSFPVTDIPDIASVRAQPAAQLVVGGGNQAHLDATLPFGPPLLLRLSVVPA
jgi:hypothetical protein